jgi:RNA polymerase sigma factor (sigma-70 family)
MLMPPHNSEVARWFAEEVLPHESALRGWLRARFPTLVDTDDLVQESYSRLLRARETGSIACPKAFLFVTARNLALNHLRHLRHERPHTDANIDSATILDERAGVPDSVEHAEDLQLLIKAIQALPERCRQVVTLRKIYGLSQKDVAAKLGISEHTVEAQGVIGLRKCTEYFRRFGYPSSS